MPTKRQKKRNDQERRRAARRAKRMAPDEAFEADGIVLMRKGRVVVVENRRSPEQQAAYFAQMRAARDALPARIRNIVGALRADLAQTSALDLLSVLSFSTFFGREKAEQDPDREICWQQVEYPSWLYLTKGLPAASAPLDPAAMERINDQVSQAIHLAHEAIGLRVLDQTGPLASYRARLAMYCLDVRAPTFREQHLPRLRDLFGHIETELLALVGITIDDALAFEQTAKDLVTRRINYLFEEVRTVRARVSAAQAGESVDLSEGEQRLLGALKGAGVTEPRVLDAFLSAFLASAFKLAFQIRSEDLADQAARPIARAEAFLALFSSSSEKPIGDSLPATYEPLELRPLLRLDDPNHVFAHLLPKLTWALKPGLERAMPRKSAIWNRYEKHRSDYLESEILRLLQRAAPRMNIWRAARYQVVSPEAGMQEFETDALATLDSALFIIEAKAGTLPLPARRGAPSVTEDVQRLVGDAYDQGLRTLTYLKSNTEVSFTTADGTATFRLGDYRHIILLAVALDHVNAHTARLVDLEDIGIVDGPIFPWAVSLDDFEIILDLLEFDAQLVHFVARRLRPETRGLMVYDELDLFGHYLSEGLYFTPADVERTHLSLNGYDKPVVDYYQARLEGRPSAPPRQKMPDGLRDLLRAIDACDLPGRVDAVLALLDADAEARRKIDEFVRGRQHRATSQGFSAFRMMLGTQMVGYVAAQASHFSRADFRAYVQAAKYELHADSAVGVLQDVDTRTVTDICIMDRPWILNENTALAARLTLGRFESSQLSRRK